MGLTQEKPKTTFHPLYFLFAFIMWLLVIGWLAVIFSLSAESADVSTLRSQDLMEKIADLFHVTVNEEIVRNCAHIFEFTVLSVFTYIAMFATNHVKTGEKPSASGRLDKIKNDNEVYISVSLWITALSAAADEYHQIFVAGRSSSLFDVFLDFSGAVVIMLIIRIVISIYLYVKNRKSSIGMITDNSNVEEV